LSKHLILAAVLAIPCFTGCASPTPPPRAGDNVVLKGKLVLKGSMPMVRVVLVRSDTEQWDLVEVPPQTAAALQNKEVTATGAVVRAVPSGMWAPSLRVTTLAETAK
jgi:hypothetical protein